MGVQSLGPRREGAGTGLREPDATPAGVCCVSPAPPSTSGPVRALYQASMGGRGVLATVPFLTGLSACSRSSPLPLGLEVLVPGWERVKAAGYLGFSAGGWSRERELEEPWHVALPTYPPGPATASRQPAIQPCWRCSRPYWVSLGCLGLARYSLT